MTKPLSAALFCLLVCGAAPAQTYEISVSAGYPRLSSAPLGSLSQEGAKDNDTKLKGLQSYSARLTRNTRGYYGHELGFSYSRARLETTLRTTQGGKTVTTVAQDRIDIRQAHYNFLMYFMPKGERWRPFMTGGGQVQEYGAPGIPEWGTGKSRRFGANYGGGIKLMLFKHALLRLDVREYIGGKPYDLTFEDPMKTGGLYRQLEASFGISIAF
jgi:hypothetical protein